MSLEVTTVRQLAEDVGIPAEKLLAQLQEALSQDKGAVPLNKKKIGLNHSIDPEQKQKLLNYLQATTGLNKETVVAPKKIILRRRKKINLVTKDNKDLVVTIRKKRTYRQREVQPEITDKVEAEQLGENQSEKQQVQPTSVIDKNIEEKKLPEKSKESTKDVVTKKNLDEVTDSEKEKKEKDRSRVKS